MISSLRTRVFLISSTTMVGTLTPSGAVTYSIVRSNTMESIDQNLATITSGNTLAIDKWTAAKARTVKAIAGVIEHDDPQGSGEHIGDANGFPIITIGQTDKSFISTGATTPKNYDPTARPQYKQALAVGRLLVTRPYGDVSTGVPYVSFAAPLVKSGEITSALSGAVPFDGVYKVMAAVHPTPSSLAFVVAKGGQVIAHPDAELMLKPATGVAASLTAGTLTNLVKATPPLEVELTGAPKLFEAQAVQGTDWYLVIALGKAEAIASLHNVVKVLAVAIVLLTLATVGIAAYFTSQSFRHLSQVRDAMDTIGSGGGDLTHRLPVVGNDGVTQISASFNTFIDKIGEVLLEVRVNIDSMKSITGEIETGSRDLSNRTEVSANNLQETSAALTGLTTSVKNSVDAAVQAARLVSDANETAMHGSEVVSSTVNTMDEIAKSSARITEIIDVIDSVTFQTDILTLNAAMEAAHADENDRGFAIVAGEVRMLAQRDTTAAREAKDLTQASEASVKTGAQRVQVAGAIMQGIAQGIRHAARIIGEIDGTMHEQSTGISQIDRNVAEMGQVTQQNAALVKQSTAASSMLNEQTHGLARTIGLLKLRSARRVISPLFNAPGSGVPLPGVEPRQPPRVFRLWRALPDVNTPPAHQIY